MPIKNVTVGEEPREEPREEQVTTGVYTGYLGHEEHGLAEFYRLHTKGLTPPQQADAEAARHKVQGLWVNRPSTQRVGPQGFPIWSEQASDAEMASQRAIDAEAEMYGEQGFTVVQQPIRYGDGKKPSKSPRSLAEAAYDTARKAATEAEAELRGERSIAEQLAARLVQQTDITLVLYERLRAVAELIEGVAWRRRRVDSELECVACRVLKSAFGGHHTPSCWIALAMRAATPSAEVEREYRLMRMRELLPHQR
jgi:hypothetical protein